MIGNLAAIAAGGALGALARYGVARVCLLAFKGAFPVGTLVVNAAGCLAIGGLMYLAIERRVLPERWHLLLITGFLGSLTTFSAFGAETLELLRRGEGGLALTNVAANFGLGMSAVWVGWAAVRWLAPGQAAG